MRLPEMKGLIVSLSRGKGKLMITFEVKGGMELLPEGKRANLKKSEVRGVHQNQDGGQGAHLNTAEFV